MIGRRREYAQVMYPGSDGKHLWIGRTAPPEALAWCVDYCWWVVWDAPEPYEQGVIPRPVVHVAAEAWQGATRLVVTGPPTQHFRRRLEQRGRTVALAFRPAGFRPFVDRPASELVDVATPVEHLSGVPDEAIADRMADLEVDVERAARELFEWFEPVAPPPDPLAEELSDLVEAAEVDSTIRRAEQLAGLAGVSLRTLQRRFREYVGPGPKWVVQRHRLLDVVQAANQKGDVDWAALAAELGYTDQSHLIRHFTSVVGEAPARYSARRATG